MGKEYERVRYFMILHYKLNGRTDSPMWQHCRDLEIPQSLSDKMQAFKTNGMLITYPWEIFGNDSWLALYDGLNFHPNTYDVSIDKFSPEFLTEQLTKMRHGIKASVKASPSHVDFLQSIKPS